MVSDPPAAMMAPLWSDNRESKTRGVDGLGDSFAILGVSLWTTISTLAPSSPQNRLRFVWWTRSKLRSWPVGRRVTSGWENVPSHHTRGGPIGPPLFFTHGGQRRSLPVYDERRERPSC